MTTALVAGLGAGLAVAVQVGAVSLLVVETAMNGGSRAGVAAGMGVATADLGFAAVAAAAGGAASAALSGYEDEIRLCAAVALAAIALHGLARLRAEPDALGSPPAAGVYRRFVAMTAVNPLTIASFAAIAASLSLEGPAGAVAFAVGAGLGSAAWHLVLPLGAARAGAWMTPPRRRALAAAGRVAVLAIAAHLALSGAG
ncbi:MAG: LysE family transporter [Thermoleophilaceae bacterium]|nr:LysE family transporter [Thermoleophilaceae bacterium]